MNTPKGLLKFMSENITYGYLGDDGKIHLPSESDFNDVWFKTYVLENYEDLLKTKVGNCWDQTEFERTWFTNHSYEVKTFYEQVLLDYENPYPIHAFLVFKNNGKWYWFENSDSDNRGIHSAKNLVELLDYQLDTYKKFLIRDYKITKVELDKICLFEFDKPKEHVSAEGYIMNATNNMNIAYMKKYLYQNNNKPKYLFHGTPKKLDVIETRWSHDSKNVKENIDNAVFLTPSLISASAYAFKDSIKKNSKDLDWDFDINNHGRLPVMVMKNVCIPNNLEGYIYVFEINSSFENDPVGSMQYKSYKDIKPMEVLKVKYEDFEKYYERK